ncbi:MAG: HutD family protein [Bdellovibrionota bacterium]
MKKIIKPEQFKIMPWKNGLGVTKEIRIFPENSGLNKGDFHWRLSSAEITDKNTFSQFAGYNRWLTIISGDGLILNGQKLLPGEVQHFRGEDMIKCDLISNRSVVDISLIYDRNCYQCDMRILENKHNQEIRTQGHHCFLIPIQKNFEVIEITGESYYHLDADSYSSDVILIELQEQI